MRYMLLTHGTYEDGEWLTDWEPEAIQAMVGHMHTLNEKLIANGELLGAEGLDKPAEARIVRAGANGTPAITDGPFAETKEFLAGFWIVEVDSAERAFEIAAEASAAPGKDGKPMNVPIEVRQVMSAPPTE